MILDKKITTNKWHFIVYCDIVIVGGNIVCSDNLNLIIKEVEGH
uniref:Uncharacterized protein n=1 Tax=Physcomitrium patens TaxID=3218 RepID=A0A2K1KBT8_PHYPA|nr:hypothetical protein PHYPA_010424 [Physcomitrium patens]